MTNLLLPYGAKKNAGLTAKGGVVKSAQASASGFAPYGSADNADLAAKVGMTVRDAGVRHTRRVVRLASNG